jgi:hypothetical protein
MPSQRPDRQRSVGFCDRLIAKSTLLASTFDRHKWKVYYREGFYPRGRRVRL